MAKKKEVLTIEEKLQNALVPDLEQPYKLPENWCWTKLTTGAAECLDKFRKPINSTERASRLGNVPYYGATGQVGFIDDYLTDEHLVLVGEDGAPFLDLVKNKAYIIDGKAWVNNHAHILKSFYGVIGNVFLMHYLNNFDYSNYVNGTTRLKLTQASMNIMPFPLPPLAEQKRIVERIESLFAKLDEAKELAQSALDSFENRESAILHKAFTGELTKKWREENGVSFDSWEEVSLNDIGNLERGKSKHRPRNDERLFGGKYPFVQTGDIARADTYVIEHKQTLSEFGLAQSKLFSKGTLCITIAANIGDVAILSYDCCFPDSVVAFTPNEKSLSKFIYYKMLTLKDDIEANAPATAQKNINLKILGELLFPVPTIPEQQEIVRILDSICAKEYEAKELVSVIDKIDLIKKSILSKAFCGELGTNDTKDENSIELLREILEEK